MKKLGCGSHTILKGKGKGEGGGEGGGED